MAIVALKNVRRMRERINVQSSIDTTDEYGDANAPTWFTNQTVWGSVEPLSFRDQERLIAAGGQLQQDITHKVVVRSIPGLTSKQRLVFGEDRVLEILSIADRRERGVLMEILCKEVVGQDG